MRMWVERQAHGEWPWRQQQRWQFWEWRDYFSVCLQALQDGENWLVQLIPGFLSSLVIKLKKIETSSLPRHDISERLPPLNCMWNQNDSQTPWLLTFRHVELDLIWDCGISAGDGRFSESQNIWMSRYIMKNICFVKGATSKHTQTSIWHDITF